MSPPSPSGPGARVLLVEGRDDEEVTRRLCERTGQPFDFEILNKGGVDNLIRSVRSDVSRPGLQSIGVVVDANEDVRARWDALTDRLRSIGVETPRSPDPNGTIIDDAPRKPRIGIWLMPDNGSGGELEDFVVQMIPAGDRVWPLSQRYIDGIPEPAFSAGKTLRAQLYAWLAAREDPRQMGLAIRARDLGVDGELCRKFVGWLARLFG